MQHPHIRAALCKLSRLPSLYARKPPYFGFQLHKPNPAARQYNNPVGYAGLPGDVNL
jgi:hypothetical protein